MYRADLSFFEETVIGNKGDCSHTILAELSVITALQMSQNLVIAANNAVSLVFFVYYMLQILYVSWVDRADLSFLKETVIGNKGDCSHTILVENVWRNGLGGSSII